MADITIDAAGNARSGRAPRAHHFTTPSIGYFFYIEADGSLVYRKTSDGGATWANAVEIVAAATSLVGLHDIWAERWTPGDTGTKIHIWWVEDTGSLVRYCNFDTDGDTLSTPVTVFDGASVSYGYGSFVTGAKARGGNLLCAFNIDDGSEVGTYRSTDSGATWTSRTSMIEAARDLAVMFPGGDADNQDMWMLYLDSSADEITLKVFDDSANSVSESAQIIPCVDFAVDFRGQHPFAGAIRHSDNHLIFAGWTERDSATGDFRVFDISAAGATLTELAALATDKDDSFFPCVHVNSAGHIYVGYVGKLDGSETQETNWKYYYAVSTDGGTTWASTNNAYSAAGSDWENAWCSLNGPRFTIVWRDFSSQAFALNVDNAVNHAPTLSTVTPSTGPTTGGTNVTIVGANFTGATGVTFGGVAATGVTVVSDTTITCAAPAGAAGASSVIVTTAAGTNAANSAYTYTVVASGNRGDGVSKLRLCVVRL